jgi:hypothetical protein
MNVKRFILHIAFWAPLAGAILSGAALAQNPPAPASAAAPPIVEWVYQVKWGYYDDFWKIFQKYQIAILDEGKKQGLVTRYIVQKGSGHVGESERWDVRILIYYRDEAARTQARGIEKKLFPDQATLRREELERWRLTTAHWDRNLTEIDPHAPAGGGE